MDMKEIWKRFGEKLEDNFNGELQTRRKLLLGNGLGFEDILTEFLMKR